MRKLDHHIEKDNRIKEVYDYAKEKYEEANPPQHNWEHIMRDLYRALVIADTIEEVDYSILIPAVLLHDIGVTESDNYKEHAEVGAEIVKRDLSGFDYEKEEITKIAECVEQHKGKAKRDSIEAKILYDADHLEKSGISGAFATYRAQLELGKSIEEWVEKVLSSQDSKNDFYTEKAKEISDNGFKEIQEHYKRVKEGLAEREDWRVKEEDLWS